MCAEFIFAVWDNSNIANKFNHETHLDIPEVCFSLQVKITPHVSGISRPQNIAAFFKKNLHRFQSNQPLESVLDLDKGY
jgi:phosphoglycerate dehydrogenase-like enzyme